MDAEGVGEAAECAAADKVAVGIVDFFQAVEIEKENGEGAAVAIGALSFAFENVEQTAVVGEAGEGIADSEVLNLFEEAGVVEQRAAECDGVTGDREGLREDKGRVQETHGL